MIQASMQFWNAVLFVPHSDTACASLGMYNVLFVAVSSSCSRMWYPRLLVSVLTFDEALQVHKR